MLTKKQILNQLKTNFELMHYLFRLRFDYTPLIDEETYDYTDPESHDIVNVITSSDIDYLQVFIGKIVDAYCDAKDVYIETMTSLDKVPTKSEQQIELTELIQENLDEINREYDIELQTTSIIPQKAQTIDTICLTIQVDSISHIA